MLRALRPVDAGLIYHVINRGNSHKIVRRAEQYRWSSYRAHGLGKTDELLDSLRVYERLSPCAAVRRRVCARMVHLLIAEQSLTASDELPRPVCPMATSTGCRICRKS
jgi:hypothetical protein